MDAEIAEKVMGWTVSRERSPYRWNVPLDSDYYREWDGRPIAGAPEFSTDIEAAMPVRAKLIDLGFDVAIYVSGASIEYHRETGDTRAVLVSLWLRSAKLDTPEAARIDAGADGRDSIPLAMCRAALLGVAALALARKETPDA